MIPLVSVCVLSWNHEKFIGQCIDSILGQTYRNIEIVYLDNGSSDQTVTIAKEKLAQSPIPYRILPNFQQQGVSKNLNLLLKQATGTYILPLSSDDWLAPDCIGERVAFYESHPDIGMLYSGGWIYFHDEEKIQLMDSSTFRRGRIYKDLMHSQNVVCFVGCFYRKDILLEVGGWDENMLIEDLDMFIRISLHYDVDFIDTPLVYYRKFSHSLSSNIAFMVRGWEQYFQKYKGVAWCDMKAWMAKKYQRYAAVSIDKKDFTTARQLLRKALRLNPLGIDNLKTLKYLLQASRNKN